MVHRPRRRSLALALALSVLTTPVLTVVPAGASSAADAAPVQVDIARVVDGETRVSTVTVAGQAAADALIARAETRDDVLDAGRATVAHPVGAVPASAAVPASPGVVNDPLYTSAYHLAATGADVAWNRSMGAGVTVAVLDTAVDTAHPDLDANVLPQLSAVTGTVVPGAPANSTGVFHGTLVSSLIAGEVGNGIGAAGVAPRARIMPITICDPSCSSAAQVAAIDYATTHGADVINMSIAGTSSSSLVEAAVARARAAGVVVVASAGNSALAPGEPNPSGSPNNGNAVMYPGASPGVLGVSSVDRQGVPSRWATHNDRIALSAYGEYAFGATPGTGGNYSSAYGAGTGTSFSGPEVAGAAALVKAVNPALTPDQVETILKSTTRAFPAGSVSGYGTGILDAGAATAAAAATLPLPPAPPAPPANRAPVVVADTATVVSGGTVLVDVLANDTDADADALTLVSVGAAAHGQTAVVGNQLSYRSTAGWSGVETVSYVVGDGAGNTATGTVDITVTAPPVVVLPIPPAPPVVAPPVVAPPAPPVVAPPAPPVVTTPPTTPSPTTPPATPSPTTPPAPGNPVRNGDGSTTYTAPDGRKVVVKGSIQARFDASGASRGQLGVPLTSETPIRGGAFNHFANGSIYWSPATGAQTVKGAIRDAWARAGWENSRLGYPTGEEIAIRDGGRVQHFQGGLAYWSPATGAHLVQGAVQDLYARQAWENSRLGYPVGDEFGVRDGGRVQEFQGGLVYWSPATGANAVWGAFRGAFAAQGWENGSLGYPRSGEYRVDARRVRQDFQGGSLFFDVRTGAVTRG